MKHRRLAYLPLLLLLFLTSCAPPDAYHELSQALTAIQEGRLSDGLIHSEICLRSLPNDTNVLLLNGYCQMMLSPDPNYKSAALFNLEKASRNSGTYAANLLYGWALCENKLYREAIPVLEKALEQMPPSAPQKGAILLLLSRCCVQSNLQEQGMRYSQPLRIYKPYRNWPEVYNNLGMLALKRADYQEADRCFQQALRLSPHDPRLLQNLAVLHDLYLNDSRKARGYYLDFMATARIQDNRELYLQVQKRVGQLAQRMKR
ncbi:MAG: tetratricopeptide repeat protein [Oligosphaeraceae bacterium]|nr:tetratricopeptide repeat protein [Oligosphaeraceae bacterium]